MRQAYGESLKSFLSRFIDEMAYCVQVTDRETLSALRGELIEHRNKVSRDLPPPQRQRARGPTSHLMDYQINQAGNESSGQAHATTTLNAVPTLAYEDINPITNTQQTETLQGSRRGRGRGRGSGPRNRSNQSPPGYCVHHRSYGHDTTDCRDYAHRSRLKPPKDRNESPQANRPPSRHDNRPRREEVFPRQRDVSPRRRKCDTERLRKLRRHRRNRQGQDEAPIHKVDTIFGGPYIGGETRNAKRNYAREAKHPLWQVTLWTTAPGGTKFHPLSSPRKMPMEFTTPTTIHLFGDGRVSPNYDELHGFLIVDSRSAYHGVLGRPALKELGAVISIYQLCMKFPTENGVTTVRGDQKGSRECYLSSIKKVEPRDIHVIIADIVMADVPGDALTDSEDIDMIDVPPNSEVLVIDEIDPA
ncbi:uncharacterized protein LOC111369054 [Olea europaea var. sylvestris]|uniref:uncharacterized protein LOC111369054 n=1 Tax=Olea europaea var. sylvestris TaxID=158386 RepID=UPI000C1D5537|nr:uncharacterized protein LOC111369054 [Olea europaea var. sylvestris]